jgi:hypothetical protein
MADERNPENEEAKEQVRALEDDPQPAGEDEGG